MGGRKCGHMNGWMTVMVKAIEHAIGTLFDRRKKKIGRLTSDSVTSR